jgi:hypothetical protein
MAARSRRLLRRPRLATVAAATRVAAVATLLAAAAAARRTQRIRELRHAFKHRVAVE